ncbi:arylsulfatase [Exophiala aquamarina CBS 119918]|uniref:Arylsulfatase n=1 Tax=Exophiala aquamarina CBS 119918 TaxID=1182545 RepID=A0A072PEV8_9EURO|nr:arylsulfatase [Exophiala aquamarina CBS 119918]KEF58669.1 arylsulfatase [Exophiala aquamarina CBS 119918]
MFSLPRSIAQPTGTPAKRPNFVFIITDDQDLHLNSIDYMPKLNQYIGAEGTFFKKHFCTIAICCPSRVSLLTGRMAHNTNVTDVNPPYGGYSKFISQDLNDKYLPVWLQEGGYNTFYTGKLFNGHNITNYNSPYPGGWTGHDFLLEPGTYRYWNATLGHDEDPPMSYPGEYNTDLVTERALTLLDRASQDDRPFFLGIAPIAPHFALSNGTLDPPEPASRHSHLFPDAQVPRTNNFNPSEKSGVSWVSTLPQQNGSQVQYNDEFYRLRLQALQAVDEMIESVVNKLDSYGILDNTYIIYTSDNGFHIGQHRLPPGKTCAFEEDINVPFYIRGPGIAKGEVTDSVTSHTDIAPTLFQLAGIRLRDEFDGSPMPIQISEAETQPHASEHVAVEYWGLGVGEGKYAAAAVNGLAQPNNTYKAIRVIGTDYNIFYSVWCTNEHELYNMTVDPGQMVNLATDASNSAGMIIGREVEDVQERLDALLFVLKTCKADQCRFPWEQLHPSWHGSSRMTLRNALDPQYDEFYSALPKVEFTECMMGQILEAEGPQWVGEMGHYWPAWT